MRAGGRAPRGIFRSGVRQRDQIGLLCSIIRCITYPQVHLALPELRSGSLRLRQTVDKWVDFPPILYIIRRERPQTRSPPRAERKFLTLERKLLQFKCQKLYVFFRLQLKSCLFKRKKTCYKFRLYEQKSR